MKGTVLGVIGLFVGAFVGFQLRPSAFLVGQLPLGTVITRGANLSGLDVLLVSTAQTSFNYMLAGAAVGAACGLAVGLLTSKRTAHGPT
jgi:hypothetical protein